MAYSGLNLPTYTRAIHSLVIIVSSYHLYPGKQIYNINKSDPTFSKYVFHIKETEGNKESSLCSMLAPPALLVLLNVYPACPVK